MTPWRIFLAFVMPPLAVLDKGCGTALLVFVLMLLGWFPGVIAAFIILSMDNEKTKPNLKPATSGMFDEERRFVEIPVHNTAPASEEAKRKGAYVRLADGEIAEVVEDDGAPLEKRKRGGADHETR